VSTEHRIIARCQPLVALLLAAVLIITLGVDTTRPVIAQHEHDDEETPQQLIAKRFEEGELDYATSLLYRTYALFGDQRLPESFATASDHLEDHALIHEIKRSWDDLPAGVQEQLTPFIVRPTDTRSIFSPESSTASPEAGPQIETTFVTGEDCEDGWSYMDSVAHPGEFRVWVTCTDDYREDLAKAVAVIEEFWQPEIDLMGPPISDLGGPDAGGTTAIDFYIVETEADRILRATDQPTPLGEWALAVAVPTDPKVERGSSGFMVARRSRLDDPGIRLDLAHEFFHILSFAHNVDIAFGFRSRPFGTFDLLQFREYWFVEATAVWVENYIYRGNIEPAAMLREVHMRFIDRFQSAGKSLHETPSRSSPDFGHIYAAYIYFLFLEQELGPQVVADIWRNLRPLPEDDWDGAMAVIDAVHPFEENFREFTVRNLNLKLLPGDPIAPHYHDLDPVFPIGIPPVLSVGEGADATLVVQQAGEAARPIEVDIPSLAAQYFFFEPAVGVGQIVLDPTTLAPLEALDIDMIVQRADGTWERRLLPVSETTTICQTVPGEDIQGFYLVLTNHDMDLGTTVTGNMTIASPATPCGA
jgi:hypothetical protein